MCMFALLLFFIIYEWLSQDSVKYEDPYGLYELKNNLKDKEMSRQERTTEKGNVRNVNINKI